MTLNQDVFAAEFILGIASFRRVSVCLHAVMEIENLSGITKRSVDLFFRPDIECALLGLCVAVVVARGYKGAIGVFGGEESAFLRCHVSRYIIKNVACDS